jgi:hypothetical protein
MAPPKPQSEEHMRKSSRLNGLIPLLIGTMVLLKSLDEPRVQALHVTDILRLVAGGMGLGVALVWLLGRFRVDK